MMAPFRTFKSLIVALIIGAVLITTLAFAIFTRRQVTHSLLAIGNESAHNVLRAVNLSIAAQYRDLQFFRQYALESRKRQVRDNLKIALAAIDQYHRMAHEGSLDESEAQAYALQYISGLTYGNNDYCFVYDSNQVAIAHPDPAIYGHNMSGIKDMKGRLVMEVMRENIQANGEGYCSLWWGRLGQTEPVEKLLYYQSHAAWNWIVGTGLYIDDIESDARRKMDAIMETLRAIFAEATVLNTGYFWLFNGRRQILIPPFFTDTHAVPADFSGPATNLFAALADAARNPDRPYYHPAPLIWTAAGKSALICSHVQRFAPLDWYIVSSVDTAELWKPVRNILWKQTLFSALLALVCILVAIRLVHRVTRPLARLTGFADQLHQNNFNLPPEAEAELLAIGFPQEVGRLARTICSLEDKLQEYLKNLAASTAARERIQSELRIAHDIQMSMLPDRAPEPAIQGGIDLHAALVPANAVGGDLYDFFMLPDGRLCLALGDVSDKGVPAALFMARSKALIRAVAAEYSTPDRILSKVNEELCRDNTLYMFVTAFLGIVDLGDGALVYSNAGHLPPFLLHGNGGCRALTPAPHKPLGIVARVAYTVEHVELAPGDGLFIYSDGITEAIDARNELFGMERLQTTLAGLTGSSARATVETVLSAVTAFAGGIAQNDDIAALALRWRPK